jgi:hypothetical protein
VAATAGRILDRQPGTRALGIEQRRSGHLGSKTVQGHGLQVVVRFDAGQQH